MWTLLRTDRRFRRLFLGETTSSFGDSAVYLSLAIWAKDLTGSDAAAGAVFLLITVPGFAAPLLGHLVDRVRRKPLMLRMHSGMAVLLLSLLAVRDSGQLWILYMVALAYGVVFSTPARQALLKDLLSSTDAVSARSLLITAREGVRIISPVSGAAAYASFGGGALALLGSGSFLVAALVLASIKVVESEPEPADEPFRTSLLAGFRYVRQVPLLRRLTLATLGFMGVVGLLESAVFAAIDDGLGQEPAFMGVVTSLQGGGSVAGGIAAGYLLKRWGESRASGAGYGLIAGGMLLCVSAAAPPFLTGAVLIGVGLPFLAVALGTAMHLYAPARMQGRVNAAVGTLSDAAQTLSIAAGAALVGVVDHRVLYLVMAVSAAVCAATVLLRPPGAPRIEESEADRRAEGGTPSAEPAPSPPDEASPRNSADTSA